MLENGTFDLAVGSFPEAPGSLVAQKLYDETYHCLVRASHPAAKAGKISLAEFTKLPHLLVAPWGVARGGVDERLEALGHRRRVAMTVAHFAAAPAVIETTDLITTLPSRLVRTWESRYRVRGLPPPPALQMPKIRLAMLWHARLTAAPLHRWARGQLAAAVAAS